MEPDRRLLCTMLHDLKDGFWYEVDAGTANIIRKERISSGEDPIQYRIVAQLTTDETIEVLIRLARAKINHALFALEYLARLYPQGERPV